LSPVFFQGLQVYGKRRAASAGFCYAHGAYKPMTIDLMGSSEDDLIRKDGKWLIRERRVAP